MQCRFQFWVMGLAFHFNGRIKSRELIPAMTHEVKDICVDLDWSYHVFDDHKFKGICFTAPGAETVFLTFDPEGRMALPVIPVEEDAEGLRFCLFCKTQY